MMPHVPVGWGPRTAGWSEEVKLCPPEERSTSENPLSSGQGKQRAEHETRGQGSGRVLTELGPIQKFSCWMYLTLS